MQIEKSFIHCFRTPGRYYIYDVNRNSIIEIGKVVYKILSDKTKMEKVSDSEVNDDVKDIIKNMIDNGFLSSNRIKAVVHPADELLEYYLDNKLRMITIQLTQQCNLRCKYCVYSGDYINRTHSSKRMSFEIAKKGIDFLIGHSKDCDHISVGFYGGEPLLEFELLKKCIEYTEERVEGKDVLFTLTTNATLLNNEIIEYFQEHKVSLIISLDGPKQVHDKNRRFAFNNCGTFDKVIGNLKEIENAYPEYLKDKISFNVVLDRENDFGCINDFFTDYEIIKDANIRSQTIDDRYTDMEIKHTADFDSKFNYELFKILLHKLDRLDEKYVSRLIKQYDEGVLKRTYNNLSIRNKLPDKAHHSGPCIPGVNRLFLTCEGELMPCERVSESSDLMKIGSIDLGFNVEKIRELLNIGKLTEDRCKECWAFRFCHLCAASADGLTEFSAKKKAELCASVKNSVEETFKELCTLNELGFNYKQQCEILI
ncbi:Cys-rich peptide radical SAM maturase CcpM [Ruminiclostridium cellobioparum]|uniref:Cys-rich peptide radical SAM maturase CcpM n=1 Tax=Ruminiclostridium cellobioparum TaxID=29355 RepID=UPI0028B21D8B|nr:Cys-rich peptide radical SAM maturase CcpM [Ruminiclostridium cellobioparum]